MREQVTFGSSSSGASPNAGSRRSIDESTSNALRSLLVEELRRIEVILPGLVNDPEVALASSCSIGQYLIELSLFQVL